MDFGLGKLFVAMTAPSHLLLAMTAVGFLWCGRQWGRWVLACAVFGWLTVALTPVSTWLLLPLEDRFPNAQPSDLPVVDGILVLGGAIMPIASAEHGAIQFGREAERLTALPALMRHFPDIPVIFTGGSGDPRRPDDREAPFASLLFQEWGLDSNRLVLETESRSTWENALNVRPIVKAGQRWLLVTSAAHMPRSMGVFRTVLPDVAFVAFPTGYNANHSESGRFGLNLTDNLERLDQAAYEWRGLVAYRLLGRSDTLFPGP